MKVKIYTLLIVLFFFGGVYAQQPTRNQLLRLYYLAGQAKNQGNDSIAVARYLEISDLVPTLSDPYLKIGEIFGEKAEQPEYRDVAIFMYRKFLDLELEDKDAILLAGNRLKELEQVADIPHYEEYIVKEDPRNVNNDNIPVMEEEEIAFVPVVKKKEDNSVPKQKEPVEEDSTAIKEDVKIPRDENTVVNEEIEQITLPENIKIVIDPTLTKENAYENKGFRVEDLVGRWVSASHLHSGRETWILDITYEHNDLRISLASEAGVLMTGKWDSGTLFERTNLLQIANSYTQITDRQDISLQTMQQMNYLKEKVVSGQIDQNGTLSFNYTIDLSYAPSAGKYDALKMITDGISNQLPSGFGFLGGMMKLGVQQSENHDTELKYYTKLNFLLNFYGGILRGSCNDVTLEVSIKGEKKTKDIVFDCDFYKVPKMYSGNMYDEYRIDYLPDKEEQSKKKKLFKEIKDDLKKNPDAMYCTAILLSQNVSLDDTKNEQKNHTKQIVKNLLRAAEKGHIPSISWLTRIYYNFSLDETNYSADIRKKYLMNAQEWTNRIKAVDGALAYTIQADYYLKARRNLEQVEDLYRRAANANNGYACNRLGEMYCTGDLVTKDYATALDYFIKAAKLENVSATLNLAKMFRDGLGVTPNVENYIRFVQKAIKMGSTDAVGELAKAYFDGIGVRQDFIKGNQLLQFRHKLEKQSWKKTLEKYGYKM